MREGSLTGREVAKDSVTFSGHPMVRSLHPRTIEITAEDHLTEKGDCIIGVSASKGCAHLDPWVKEGLRRLGSQVTLSLVVGQFRFEVKAHGDPGLELSHPKDLVIRKSEFVSDRTLAIRADRASIDIPREMVRLLRNPATNGTLEIEVV